MNRQQIPDDWADQLFMKRVQGRRMRAEGPPPYMTTEGMVMVDRRSHHDRRKSACATAARSTIK